MLKEKTFIVRTSGMIVHPQEKIYSVKAPTKDIAEKKAIASYEQTYDVADYEVQAQASSRSFQTIIAIVCLAIAVLLSFIPWKTGHETKLLQPDYTSCVFAAFFYVVFVVRFKGIRNVVRSVLDLVFMVLLILLISSFIKAILVQEAITIPIPFKKLTFNINTSIILVVALLLSAFGMKLVSVVCLGIVMVFAMVNIAELTVAMGSIWGPVYIIASLIGVLSYLSLEPILIEAFPHYKRMGLRTVSRIKSDVTQAGNEAKRMSSFVSEKMDNKNKYTEKTIENYNKEN